MQLLHLRQSVPSKAKQLRVVGVAIQLVFDADLQKLALQVEQLANVASVHVAQFVEQAKVHFPELFASVVYPFPAQPSFVGQVSSAVIR